MYEQPLFAGNLSLKVLEGQGGRTKIQWNSFDVLIAWKTRRKGVSQLQASVGMPGGFFCLCLHCKS